MGSKRPSRDLLGVSVAEAPTLSEEEEGELGTVFAYADADKSGRLTLAVAARALGHVGFAIDEETLASYFGGEKTEVDVDEFLELAAVCIGNETIASRLQKWFRLLDRRGLGYLEVRDVIEFFRDCGDELGDAFLAQELVDELDGTGEGERIVFEDFAAFCRQAGLLGSTD